MSFTSLILTKNFLWVGAKRSSEVTSRKWDFSIQNTQISLFHFCSKTEKVEQVLNYKHLLISYLNKNLFCVNIGVTNPEKVDPRRTRVEKKLMKAFYIVD